MAMNFPGMMQMSGIYGAARPVPAPSVTDITLLERTCRTALYGVSRIVSVHLGVSLVLLLVAFILILGNHPRMSHTMVNFSTALLTLAAVVIVMDMVSGKGFFQAASVPARAALAFVFVGIISTWLMHNLIDSEDKVIRVLPMLLLALAAGAIGYLRYSQTRVDEQYINAKAALPGYMRPYRQFIQQLDAQIDNALFSGKGNVNLATEDAGLTDTYKRAKNDLSTVLGRFNSTVQADEAVKRYLSSASDLLHILGAPEQPTHDATAPSLAQLASRNLDAIIRM
jgi:hypothetical protein